MTKREFLDMLNNLTSRLSESERDRLLEYYSEIIDDRMEEGLSEAEAVAALGDPAALTRDFADPAAEGVAPEVQPAGESVAALNGLRIRVDSADVTIARGTLDNGAAAQLRFSDPARFEWRMEGDVMEIVEKTPEGPRFSLQRVLHLLSSPAQRVKITLATPLNGVFSCAAGGGDLLLEGVSFGGGAGIDSASGDVTLRIPHYNGTAVKVSVDGREGCIAYPPYELALGKLPAGEHMLELTLLGNRHNGFGPVHLADPKHTWIGPNAWRTAGSKWTESYRLKTLGITTAPRITEAL